MKRTFFIQTMGCRLNQAESQELESLLLKNGWQKSAKPMKAGLIVLNSCVVTQKAEQEVRQEARHLRRINPKAKIVLAGCWVDKVKKFGGLVPEGVDLMVGNKEKWKKLIQNSKVKGQKYKSKVRNKAKKGRCLLGIADRSEIVFRSRALIRIQTGCSNICSYCLPRLVRGKPVSAPIEEVIRQVKQAVNDGVLVVILTGQNVSQYFDRGKDWIDLVEEILKKTKIKLLRLGSVNPALVEGKTIKGFPVERLVGLYQGVGKGRLSRHLHLSSQSGSDRVLKRMNRNFSVKQFLSLVSALRDGVEGINVTTDIIVGFPGETEKDFQQTIDFVKKAKFGKIHIFRYSSREGTLAAKREKEWGIVDVETKKQRAKKLSILEEKLRLQFWQSQTGKNVLARVWAKGRGLADSYIPVVVENQKRVSRPKLLNVKLIGIEGQSVLAIN